MSGKGSSRGNKNKREAWKNHPLVKLLRTIREKHGVSQKELSARMNLPDQTIRLVEEGHQKLPHLIDETGYDLSAWLRLWLIHVGATKKERAELEQVLQDIFISQFKDDLDSVTK